MKYRLYIRTDPDVRNMYAFKGLTEEEVNEIKRQINGNRSSPNAFLYHVREDGSSIMINLRHVVTIEFTEDADLAQ